MQDVLLASFAVNGDLAITFIYLPYLIMITVLSADLKHTHTQAYNTHALDREREGGGERERENTFSRKVFADTFGHNTARSSVQFFFVPHFHIHETQIHKTILIFVQDLFSIVEKLAVIIMFYPCHPVTK